MFLVLWVLYQPLSLGRYLGAGKIHESKVLIAVTSCSNYKINGFCIAG
ncbi:MAG: hypothetical protein ACJAU1_000539 [Psychromonas sp.]|jgi:hypothetical protein